MLVGNLIVQIGLFAIEVLAFIAGTIPLLSGIIGNSVLHVLLATGFAYYAFTMRVAPAYNAKT